MSSTTEAAPWSPSGRMRDAVRVYAPGSVSNLGPGFDCLGAAVGGRGDVVAARRVDASGVSVAFVSDPRISCEPQRNTAAIAAASVLRRVARAGAFGIELSVEKGLPLAGGLGGSAASAVAGALAANELLGRPLTRADLLLAALDAEAVVAGRHADNIAPSLVGGAVLVASMEPIVLATLDVHAGLRLALVTPDYAVETAQARAVLPASVARGAAVGQAARLAALVLGLERGDCDLIRGALEDAIAEPARAALYPGAAEAKAAGREAGALGVVVSGAGPTLVALVEDARAQAVAEALGDAYRRRGIGAVTHVAEVDARGARVES